MADDATNEAVIDFGAGQSSLEELSGAAPRMWNLLSDAASAVRQRPGLRTWTDSSASVPNASPVLGMFAWREFLLYVCADRTIWAWYGPGDIRALSSTDVTTRLDGSLRPVFAYDFERVVITGGGAPQKWEGEGLTARLGGSPPAATHIGYSAQRFIVCQYNNTGVLQWTPPGVGNHEVWTTAGVNSGGFAEAEAAADPVLALAVNTNEVFAFGTETTQVFIPDATDGFVVASTLSVGSGARFSVIDTDDSYVWVDERHRIVSSSGRDFQVLSSPNMAKSIAELSLVSDCWGFRARIGSFDLVVWQFPTAGRTLCYDRTSGKWSEWKGWTGREWSAWIGQSYYYWAARNVHLVGLATGEIVEMSFGAYADMGLGIKAVSRTGFSNAGSGRRKLAQRVQVQLKRGETLPGYVAPTMELRYRDDLGAFQSAVNYSLGAADYAPTIVQYGLGMYRERQYEVIFQNNAEFVLTEVRETSEMGDS